MKRLEGGAKRVVVAMSGGVDSSTVAGLLVEAGHEVIGVMMKLYDQSSADPNASKQCCGLDDVADTVVSQISWGSLFTSATIRRPFRTMSWTASSVIGLRPYTKPCVRCNDTVKFKSLLKQAQMLGADFLATGHYARTVVDDEGTVSLWKGIDAVNQTYFLTGMSRGAPEGDFPLGDMTKDEVRDHDASR